MATTDRKFWNEYYGFWDDFVRKWFENRPNDPTDNVSVSYNAAVPQITFDELPTPYLGAPDTGVSAVIINLNPGLSETIGFGDFAGRNSDETQYWSNLNNPIGWMIREFRDRKHLSYREYVNEWSCLNPALLDSAKYPQWCCGVHWWQGYESERIQRNLRRQCSRHNMRIPWLQQVYNNSHINALNVFALELCPFHSKRFSLSRGEEDVLVPFIQKRVFLPAAMAVKENDLPFAVAVGLDVGSVISAAGAQLEKEWAPVSLPCWPTGRNGKCVRRKYRMYKVELEDGLMARVLVTFAPGGCAAPSREFDMVEESVRVWVENNPM